MGLGQPRGASFIATLQFNHRTAPNMWYQPDLSVLDPHRSDHKNAPMVRGGVEHPIASPRTPRAQRTISGCKLCRCSDYLGQDVWHICS
ncbi:UNVERIFIED_CONTAM: hypothetical protein GTU68_004433 [Idotea baltica]|nr:hypothetical protein [Idotea baltica]